MITTRRQFLTKCSGAAIVLATGPQWAFANGTRRGGALAIIVAKDMALSAMSIHDLRQLYLGTPMRGPGGKQLTPLNLGAASPERVGFEQSVLNMSPSDVSRYWTDRKIRGQGGMPHEIDTTANLLRVVARADGMVGYARLDAVTSQVKVLRIDGHLPGDIGYRIIAAGR